MCHHPSYPNLNKTLISLFTDQLMMDTLNNPQYVAANNDAELLRQQEAFINQNRIHIEKRRHERSPERERSYSPPRRDRRPYSRERDPIRKPPYNSYNRGGGAAGGQDGGRGKRANSRDAYYSKRRRSNSTERDDRKIEKVIIYFYFYFLSIVIM